MKTIYSIVNEFSDNNLKIVVIGDLILDRYIKGSVTRVSQEAPVPVVLVESEEFRLGGSANICNNITALGSRCIPISYLGKDLVAYDIFKALKNNNISNDYLHTSNEYTSVEKTRIIGMNQQIVRIDREAPKEISEEHTQHIIDNLEEINPDAIIIEDYAKGVITNSLITKIKKYKDSHKNVFILMDPSTKSVLDFSDFSFLDILKPNLEEAFKIAKKEYHSPDYHLGNNRDVSHIFSELYKSTNCKNILVTASKYGMYKIHNGIEQFHQKSIVREVADVCGCGDTCASVYTLSILCGATEEQAMYIASTACGLVASKFGTSTIKLEELIDCL